MIGSVSPIAQGFERVSRRTRGSVVQPSVGAAPGGDRSPVLALPDLRSDADRQAGSLRLAGATADLASAPFLTQLAALSLGDAMAGERRIHRDPQQILARADAVYRDGHRRVSELELGFLGTAEY